ncbi:S8 family serine peptidase [Micromonospora sp. NPDC050495]|uniref:S8 family serine peptidase n=1 Tax=Micromonospora sp. NPDC050495 TaxID=3154936 RepID=UPI0033E63A8C
MTLLTGDRVRLTVAADQTVAVSLTPRPRSDGSTPSLDWYASDDAVYVVPDDAKPHLDAGQLDRRLFDVAYLARYGFTDGAVDGLPLIIEYPDRVAPAAALRTAGVEPAAGRPLGSIDATALDVPRGRTAGVWASVSQSWAKAAGARSAASPIQRVWLDGMSRVTLDESVPQIGAPQAWSAGLDGTGVTVAVLDTGLDFDHPDVAGRVTAARGFIDGEGTADGFGHGTHVATTIAGSGAASGGRYRGVAPGASLAIGKVCTNTGLCPLYRNGVKVSPDVSLGFPGFPMAAEVSDYRLVMDLTTAEDRSITEWQFRSGAGSGVKPADGFPCLRNGLFGGNFPCQVEPLLFMRYAGLDTDLRDRVAAPGAHRFEVAVDRQLAASVAPGVAGLKLWASYDNGTTWHEAKVTPLSAGRYSVTVAHPAAIRRATDSVTLRAEAWDTAGNRIRQTLPDAYRLTERNPRLRGAELP